MVSATEINTVGIIGGTGKIGSMFHIQFSDIGIPVIVSDESTPDKEQQILNEAQLIIICVPISDTATLLRKIRPHLRKDAVLTDFTSVKTKVVEELNRCDCEVISCHPLFGPMQSIKGQNMIMIPVKPGPRYNQVKEIWQKMRLNVTEIESCQKHDEYMSLIQGLVHFLHISFVSTLRALNIDIHKLMEICSPVYLAYFAFSCRITGGDEYLYTDIVMNNPKNKEVIEKMTEISGKLLENIDQSNRKEFLDNFVRNRHFLGKDNIRELMQESNFMVEKMSEFMVNNRKNED